MQSTKGKQAPVQTLAAAVAARRSGGAAGSSNKGDPPSPFPDPERIMRSRRRAQPKQAVGGKRSRAAVEESESESEEEESEDPTAGGKVEFWSVAESIANKRWVGRPPTEEYCVVFADKSKRWITADNTSPDLIRTFERSYPTLVIPPCNEKGDLAYNKTTTGWTGWLH